MCYRGNLLSKVGINDLPCQGRIITASDDFGAGQNDATAAWISALSWSLDTCSRAFLCLYRVCRDIELLLQCPIAEKLP